MRLFKNVQMQGATWGPNSKSEARNPKRTEITMKREKKFYGLETVYDLVFLYFAFV